MSVEAGKKAPDFTAVTDGGKKLKLSDLRGSLMGNDKLEQMLLEAVGDADKLAKLKGEMATEGGASNE